MSTTIEGARALHDIRMPLNNGHDEIPALGFGTLIPDPIATRIAIKVGTGGRISTARRFRTVPQ